MTAHLSQSQLSIQASSIPKLSSALSNSAVLDSLQKAGASFVGLLQSRTGLDMSGQNSSRHSMIPFGYIFAHENSQSEPLLNVEENGFLAQFYQQQHPQYQQHTLAQQRTHSHSHPRSQSLSQSQTQTHPPIVPYPGLDRLEDSGTNTPNLDWLINEPPPTIHDISTASIPPTTLGQQRHGQLSMSEMDINMHHDILRAAALLSQSLQTSAHTPIQPIHDHTSISPNAFGTNDSQAHSLLPQHLFSSSAVREPNNTSIIAPVHTDDALADINTSTTLNDMQIPQRSALLNALRPRLDTSSTTLAAVPVSQQSGSYTAPLLNRIHQAPNPRLYHFGSDKHFDNNGYRPSSNFERADHRTELPSSELGLLKSVNQTPEMSREPSSSSSSKHTELFSKTVASLNRLVHKRKTSDESGSSLLEDEEARATGARKRARRASAPGLSRSKRENLSNQQKRQNHIASEQKRRAQIKQGYDELNQIVPELRDGSLSKSGMLTETCNFLEQLVDANEKLRQRLGLSSLT